MGKRGKREEEHGWKLEIDITDIRIRLIPFGLNTFEHRTK